MKYYPTGMVVFTFNPSIWEAEAGGSLNETSLVCIVSSRTARAKQRNPTEKKKTCYPDQISRPLSV